MSHQCSKCDTEMAVGDDVYEVRMRDKDAVAPDLEFYTITVCSEACVKKISRSGRVQRVSFEESTYTE